MSLADAEPLLRGAVLGYLLLFALHAIRLPDRRARWLAPALAMSAAAFHLLRAGYAAAWPGEVRLGLQLLAIPGIYFFWALSRLLFEDRFALRPWHAALVAAMLAAALASAALPDATAVGLRRLLRLAIQLPALALAGHVLWRVVRDYRDDLVEPRRRLRWVFFGGGALLAMVSLVPRWLPEVSQLLPSPGGIAPLAAAFLLMVVLMVLLTEFRQPHFFSPGAPPARPPTDSAPEVAVDAERIGGAMREHHLYRENGLTTVVLARKVGMPEYRLRRAIRQQGYRNFSDFLNAWRLPEAARRLSDPGEAHLPILTIGLEAGYGSIGPFNRAFKAAMGSTPSEFRRRGGAFDDARAKDRAES